MRRAKIVVSGGTVVGFEVDGEGSTLTAGEALYEVLKKLGKEGWVVDGDLPPFTTEGAYRIPIVKEQ